MCNPTALTARYLDVLNNHLGLSAEAPDELNGDVTFITNEYTCILINHAPHDPEYLEINLYLHLEDGNFSSAVLDAAASRITKRIKSLKVIHDDLSLLFTLDSVIAPPNTIPAPGMLIAVIPRLLATLHQGLDQMRHEMAFYALTEGLESDIETDAPSPID